MNSTPSIAQIDEQIELERDQIRQGLKRLQDQSIKLENQDYASATIMVSLVLTLSYLYWYRELVIQIFGYTKDIMEWPSEMFMNI